MEQQTLKAQQQMAKSSKRSSKRGSEDGISRKSSSQLDLKQRDNSSIQDNNQSYECVVSATIFARYIRVVIV